MAGEIDEDVEAEGADVGGGAVVVDPADRERRIMCFRRRFRLQRDQAEGDPGGVMACEDRLDQPHGRRFGGERGQEIADPQHRLLGGEQRLLLLRQVLGEEPQVGRQRLVVGPVDMGVGIFRRAPERIAAAKPGHESVVFFGDFAEQAGMAQGAIIKSVRSWILRREIAGVEAGLKGFVHSEMFEKQMAGDQHERGVIAALGFGGSPKVSGGSEWGSGAQMALRQDHQQGLRAIGLLGQYAVIGDDALVFPA
ncbi:hypothetical protein [Rhizobium sp. G21]|uniref:hypothetical protein n=1 Tax=Rhizobium sp. G21 TaxID=2758439 RepID=UPI001602AF22|nr:hypothetical protein [Rhizobium sp. G21]MBB1250820.1 hypothetical protein [Rhizobium sp. G21]